MYKLEKDVFYCFDEGKNEFTPSLTEKVTVPHDFSVNSVFKAFLKIDIQHNEYVKAVNQLLYHELAYNNDANKLRLDPEAIKTELGLSKLPTEKQTQAYIDNKLEHEYNDLKISKENVKIIKDNINLLEQYISLAMTYDEVE